MAPSRKNIYVTIYMGVALCRPHAHVRSYEFKKIYFVIIILLERLPACHSEPTQTQTGIHVNVVSEIESGALR